MSYIQFEYLTKEIYMADQMHADCGHKVYKTSKMPLNNASHLWL